MPSFPGGVGLMMGLPWDNKPVCVPWSFGMMGLHPPMNYDVRWCIVRGKPVAEAREEILEAAVKEKCRYLMFLGTDVTGPAYGVRQLIYHLENFREKKFAIAGGIYCNKGPAGMPMVFRGNGLGSFVDWKIGEVFEVTGIGMDFTCINVEMVKDLPKPWFKTIDSVEDFREGVFKAEHWTEDLWFCKKAQDAGLRIMADGGLLCSHWDNLTATEYTLPTSSKPWRLTNEHLEVQKGEKKIVDLGCGEAKDSYHTDEGKVVRVDIREEVQPDYRCDLRQLPFKTGEFDVVFSSHTLEHFSRVELPVVLDEWVRIMKEDGEFRMVLPNLEWAAQQIMNGEINANVMNVLYGAQTYTENHHKMGFTPKMIEQVLGQRGFKKFEWKHDGYHMVVRAWKKDPASVDNLVSISGSLKNVVALEDEKHLVEGLRGVIKEEVSKEPEVQEATGKHPVLVPAITTEPGDMKDSVVVGE